MKTYTAQELAALLQQEGDSGMSVRKIRYYRKTGILPDLLTNKNHFTEDHLHFLRSMRTMKKTGESLQSIQGTLSALSNQDLFQIGLQNRYYSPENLVSTETLSLHPDVSFMFDKQIHPLFKQEILPAVSLLVARYEKRRKADASRTLGEK